jgi:hypothetical protein
MTFGPPGGTLVHEAKWHLKVSWEGIPVLHGDWRPPIGCLPFPSACDSSVLASPEGPLFCFPAPR